MSALGHGPMAAGGAGGGRASAAAGCRAAQSPEAGARSGPQSRSLRPSPPPRRAGGRAEWPLRCGPVPSPPSGVPGVTPGASRPLPPQARFGSVPGRHRRGRLAVPERAESRFPYVAEEAPGMLEWVQGAGCGAQAAGTGCKNGVRGAELWAPEGPGRLARRNAPRLLGGRGAGSSFRGVAPEPLELNDTDVCSLRMQDRPELLWAWQVREWAAGPQPPNSLLCGLRVPGAA